MDQAVLGYAGNPQSVVQNVQVHVVGSGQERDLHTGSMRCFTGRTAGARIKPVSDTRTTKKTDYCSDCECFASGSDKQNNIRRNPTPIALIYWLFKVDTTPVNNTRLLKATGRVGNGAELG